ncbi:hypothetical protein J4225_04185 [Candidatus Pacearchaeota archaeon]|nr:hypothetical protein [Candidatus Pacearchaeota archaeon]
MRKVEILRYALINAFVTAFYIILIASFLYSGERFFGDGKTVLIPIAMLMLLVFSAAFTGFLIFGKPIMWYLDNKKKEAFSLLIYTLSLFLIITLIALLFLTALVK